MLVWLPLVRPPASRAQGVRRQVHEAHRQEPGARLAGRLHHVSLHRRGDPEGGLDRHRQARRRVPRLKVETPIGSITFRASDGQSTMGAWVGTTKLDAKRGVGVLVNYEYVPGDRVLPSDDEVKKMRIGN